MRIDRRNFLRTFGLAASGLFVPGTLLAVPPFRRVIRPDYSWMYRGLVGWWPLDNHLGPGGTAKDWSTQRNNGSPQGGIVIGGATDQHGQGNRATAFVAASGQYINTGTGDGTNLGTHNLSFSFWFKTADTSTEQMVSRRSTDVSGNARFDGYSSAFLANGTVNISFRHTASSDTDTSVTSASAFNDNKWHFLVGAFTRSGNEQMWINGVSQGTASIAYASAANINLLGEFTIGARKIYTSPVDIFFNGSIDDVRIYNRALSAAEVRNLYNLERVFPYTEFLQ